MNTDKNILSVIIENGIKITTYENGSQLYEPFDYVQQIKESSEKSFWQKVKSWWKNLKIKPYFEIGDLADPLRDRKEKDPFDPDIGHDGKKIIKIGVKVDF